MVSGAGELKKGTGDLLSGTKELSNGTEKLSDGSKKLKTGILDLKNGAKDLKEGQQKFYEEGIEELDEKLSGEFSELLERFRAVCSEEALYSTFTEREKNMDGNVKFILRTEPIEIRN